MTREGTTPLRERMIEDRRICGMGEKAQQAHIRAIKDFASFLKLSPDTATPEDLADLPAPHTDDGIMSPTFNAHCDVAHLFRHDLRARGMQLRTHPRKLPVACGVEEVSDLTETLGPGLKYHAALSISYDTASNIQSEISIKLAV